MVSFHELIVEIIFYGTEIISFQNIEVNSEGQRLSDTSTGNLSRKFTSSGLPAFENQLILLHIASVKSENETPMVRESATSDDKLIFVIKIIFLCGNHLFCVADGFAIDYGVWADDDELISFH